MPPNCLKPRLGSAGQVLGGQFGETQNFTGFLYSGDFYATFSKKVAEKHTPQQLNNCGHSRAQTEYGLKTTALFQIFDSIYLPRQT
ncbi:hypothetical protein A3C68_00105 [Candidatus Kuenenbacteria bacterium RIFCSPHIGHO2_02_FULL_42_29]|uniref:Uncharacterized protein n=1 Tax=Candidatus Kuenenbacteria bacterium RIFCSPLOWO2_02_FULL_42_16 TaxID=1798564 RepID=A0A1F6FV26_9BACT|nr:MAG: hypothetical protein A3C68_00105 [Candidatus Kuenenbacteria bacterium RIFCSPHIGHO2_02_FULL_42_29]OGG89713.1 MAG: hypothetical protein A3H55_03735 [Candidatus Kuenenbacteria bacterium RIFCSPLOWO2_02_FULL_42_16]